MTEASNIDELKDYKDTKWFAKFFNRSEERIRQLSDMGIMPRKRVKGVNYYKLIVSIQNYIQYLQDIVDNRKKTSEDQEREKLEADIAFKRAKAKLAELDLKQLEAKLLRAEDVQTYTEDLAATIKSALSALPGRLSMDVYKLDDPAEISEIITDAVNEVLETLTRYEFSLEYYKERIAERHGKEVTEVGEDIDD